MEIPEILPIFVTCSFILCLFRGRSFWMKVDFFYTVVLGSIYYFCPQWLLDKQIQETSDLIHGYMLNLSGAAMLGVAVIQYLTRNTNDAWVTSSIMFSKIVAYGTVLANSVIGHLKPGEEHWNEHHFFISICIPAAALLCSIRYTMLCYVGAHSSNKRFNKIAVSQFLDLLVLVFLGFYQCCYPEESLFVFDLDGWKMDKVHVHMMRSLGGRVLAFAFLAFGTFSFRHHSDKQAYFKGRIVMFVLYLVSFGYHYYTYQFLQHDLFMQNIAISIIILTNCAITQFFGDAVETKPFAKKGK